MGLWDWFIAKVEKLDFINVFKNFNYVGGTERQTLIKKTHFSKYLENINQTQLKLGPKKLFSKKYKKAKFQVNLTIFYKTYSN